MLKIPQICQDRSAADTAVHHCTHNAYIAKDKKWSTEVRLHKPAAAGLCKDTFNNGRQTLLNVLNLLAHLLNQHFQLNR